MVKESVKHSDPYSQLHIKGADMFMTFNMEEIKYLKELYEFYLEQHYADRNLIERWKKPGYEHLCCLHCIQPRDHNFVTTCAYRVPKHLRKVVVIKVLETFICGTLAGIHWRAFSRL
ncbi:protein BUD31 homolog 1-like [Nicotiana tomentosiformis]|uniref:protein BUD31 homolog 1-like n=1 Tax=Nicotiana tomentosiformis TaxID=4098 RepID=UPI00388C99BC